MKNRLVVLASLMLFAGLVCFVPSHGQEAPTATVQIEGVPGTGRTLRVIGGGSGTQSEIGRIMAQLREATEAAKKAELTKQLEKAVTKSFDEDMKARETELTRLEERLKKLKDQLDRRQKAKADIIQLQMKVLANEAEGLGFSRTSALGEIKVDPSVVLPAVAPRFAPSR